MPRPKAERRIRFSPDVTYFKPRGTPLSQLEEVAVGSDEIEAVRLVDVEAMPQLKAASMMNISQPTFARILSSARKKIAQALIKGMAIRLEEPNHKEPENL